MILFAGATLGLVNASVKMGFPGVTATDLVLYTLMGQAVVKCVLVKMMPIVIRQMVLALARQDGLVLTALFPVKKASTARIANMIVTARMGQSVIQPQENVIVLRVGVEYFVTLNVLRADLEKSVKSNIIVLMGDLVTI